MVDTQYGITIMGGREVSRPYRFFFAEGERFFMFFVSVPPVFIHRTNKRGTLLIAPKHAEGMSLRYGEIVNFDTLSQKKPRNGGFFCGYLFYALEFVTD